jgi:hypothetical protein
MTAWIAEWLQWWAGYYADHTSVSGALRFLHLAGIVVGGGTALAADRLILAAGAAADRRDRVLATLSDAHRVVVPCLVGIGLTGFLMFAADAEAFLASSTYRLKMATVVLLAANGGALVQVERRVRAAGAPSAWSWLQWVARASTALWLGLLLLGVLLSFA